MLLELARPVTLLGSILSLLLVFHTAFLGSETDLRQRVYDSLGMLMLAAAFSLLSGLTFRESGGEASVESVRARHRISYRANFGFEESAEWHPRAKLRLVSDHGRVLISPRRELALSETFPVRVFLWASSIMAVLFVLSWFLETYVVTYRGRLWH